MSTSPIPHLFLLTGIFFLNFIARIVLAPLMPGIEAEMGIGHGEAGSLFLLISLGYFITLLASGFVSSRMTHRKTIILSAVAVGLSLLATSFIGGFWGMRLGLVLLGMSAGIYLPSGIATLTSLIRPEHWGKALAVHELAPNLSFVAAPLLTEALLRLTSWRGVLASVGCASILMGLLFSYLGKGGEFSGQSPGLDAFKAILSRPAFYIMAILFSLGIGSTLGLFTMLPLFLVAERGIDQNWANTLVGLSRISGVFMAFLAGWVSDRLGPAHALKYLFFLTGLATFLLGALPGQWAVIMVFIQPVVAVCFFPAGFAAISSIGPAGLRNVAVSLTVPFAFLVGAGAIPVGIGLMGDHLSFSLGIMATGALIFTGSILSNFLRLSTETQVKGTS